MTATPGRQTITRFVTLILVQAATCFVAIGLLGRMSPAIQRVLKENVYSGEATERMLVVLAEAPVADEAAAKRFFEALGDADRNVTEPDERGPIRVLHAAAPAALRGDPDARRLVVEATVELGRINRRAVAQADAAVKRLGTTGARGAALLSLIGVAVGLFAIGRTRSRLLSPVAEAARVLETHRGGERRARCRPQLGASPELRRLLEGINAVLDEATASAALGSDEPVVRRALVKLLERQPEPTAVIDREGELVCANAAALDALGGERGKELRGALRRVAGGAAAAPELITRVEELGGERAKLCVLAR